MSWAASPEREKELESTSDSSSLMIAHLWFPKMIGLVAVWVVRKTNLYLSKQLLEYFPSHLQSPRVWTPPPEDSWQSRSPGEDGRGSRPRPWSRPQTRPEARKDRGSWVPEQKLWIHIHPLQRINKLACLPMLLLTLAPLPSDCHWLTTIFVTDFILNLLSFVFWCIKQWAVCHWADMTLSQSSRYLQVALIQTHGRISEL